MTTKPYYNTLLLRQVSSKIPTLLCVCPSILAG